VTDPGLMIKSPPSRATQICHPRGTMFIFVARIVFKRNYDHRINRSAHFREKFRRTVGIETGIERPQGASTKWMARIRQIRSQHGVPLATVTACPN
jgi:hypothetical protein